MAIWLKVIPIKDIPTMGSRKVIIENDEIALFKTKDGSIFAINNICPHKQGKLSEGLVHESKVTCPLHNWDIDLASGNALGNDSGCTNVYESKIKGDFLFINY